MEHTNRKNVSMLLIACLMLLATAGTVLGQTRPAKKKKKTPAVKKVVKLREIRVAVFNFDVLKGVDVQAAAVTDQIDTMLSALSKVTIVNREQIKKVAAEHSIALSGMVNTASAVKLGKFLSAQYIVVGRASKIGHTHYLVMKIVDVETTVQTTISAKASVENGFEAVLKRLEPPLKKSIRKLQRPVVAVENARFVKLRKAVKPLGQKVFLVTIDERHINRPLRDPAAQMSAANRLRSLGFTVIVPKDPKPGWKESLLETGKYAEKKVDFLIEGDGVSAFAARMGNLISCRARVELRVISLPGRSMVVSDKGVAARVDLVEALAAKSALEDASRNATDAALMRLAKQVQQRTARKKKTPAKK